MALKWEKTISGPSYAPEIPMDEALMTSPGEEVGLGGAGSDTDLHSAAHEGPQASLQANTSGQWPPSLNQRGAEALSSAPREAGVKVTPSIWSNEQFCFPPAALITISNQSSSLARLVLLQSPPNL